MKKNSLFRKMLAAGLSGAMLAALLTGCGAASGSTKSSGAAGTTAAAAAGTTAAAAAGTTAAGSTAKASTAAGTADQKPVSIRLFVSYATADPGWAPTKAVVDKFMKDNPNIKVEVENQGGTQYHEKLVSEIASDTMPNVFQHWGGAEMHEAVAAGKVVDVTDRIDADTQLKDQLKASMNGFNVKYQDIKGTWGVPFCNVAGGFYYNTELFQKAGITKTPDTWDEMDEDIEKLKAIDVIPWALGAKDGWRVEHLYSALFYKLNGCEAAKKLADRTMKYSDAGAVETWKLIKNYADTGAFGPEPASVDFSSEESLFQTGKAAMDFSLSVFMETFTGKDSPITGKVGFFPVPSFKDKPEYKNNNFGGGDIAYGIASHATPEQIEASWKLCKAFCSPEGETEYANANAALTANTAITPDANKIDPLFKPFSEVITKADAALTDVMAYDTVSTMLQKVRDTGVAVVNGQVSPEEAGKEIDAEIADNE